MVYKLIVTERAEEQLDECLYYLVYRLGNNIAAEHLLACIEKAYDCLEENPYQFPECRDAYLKSLKYREVILYGYVLLDDCQSSRFGGIYYGDISSTGGLRE